MGSINAEYEEFPITFEKGLVTEVEESSLEMGQASEVLNWEPAAPGGLRARNAWSSISTDGLPTDYKVRGWGNYAVASGEGFAIPAIVQDVVGAGSAESGDVAIVNALTATLAGTVAGNILVAAVTTTNTVGNPSVSAGYTVRASISNTGIRCVIYTKVASGGTEAFTATDVSDIHQVHLFEVSGLDSETPTDTDSATLTSLFTLSCDSVVNTGFALIVGMEGADNAWIDSPSLTTIQSDITEPAGVCRSTIATQIYSSSPVSDSVDSASSAAGAAALAIWDAGSAASTPAAFYLLLAVATDTGYSIYQIPRDQILTGTWELVDSEATSDTSAFVSMATGTGELVWSASTMTNPRYVVISTLTGNDLTDLSSKSGRTVCFHKDRIFMAGSTANPTRLYFSGIATPHTFTTATDYIDVGGEDGEAIEDLVSVEGLLLVCKVNRLYLISGSGIESFFVNELPGGTASTGRPAIRTPYGTIVAGPTDIWVVQGGGVDPLSRPLGATYSISGLVSTAYAQDTVLIADSGTGRVYRVNLVTGAWGVEEVTAGENQVGHLFSLQGRFYYGVMDSATEVGGTRRLSSTRGVDELTGTTAYQASSGRMAMMGPSMKYSPRYLYLQLRLQDVTKPNNLRILIESDTATVEHRVVVNEATQREAISLGRDQLGSEWLKLTYEAASSATAAAIDIEKTVLGAIQEKNRP